MCQSCGYFFTFVWAYVPTVITAESFYWSAGTGISSLIQKYPEKEHMLATTLRD